MDAGELVPDSVTNEMVRDRLGRAGLRARASCSTATRAPSPRSEPRRHARGARHRARPRRRADRRRDRGRRPAAPPRRGPGPHRRHRGRSSGTAWRSTPSRPPRWSTSTASAGCWSGSTASARSTRSPPGSRRPWASRASEAPVVERRRASASRSRRRSRSGSCARPGWWSPDALDAVRARPAPGRHHRSSSTRSPSTSSATAGATPSFLGYGGRRSRRRSAPRSTTRSCTASRARGCCADGDLVSIDCGAIVDGWHGDAAFTTIVAPGRRRAPTPPTRR